MTDSDSYLSSFTSAASSRTITSGSYPDFPSTDLMIHSLGIKKGNLYCLNREFSSAMINPANFEWLPFGFGIWAITPSCNS